MTARGRDVPSLGLFQLNARTNQFTFAWPMRTQRELISSRYSSARVGSATSGSYRSRRVGIVGET